MGQTGPVQRARSASLVLALLALVLLAFGPAVACTAPRPASLLPTEPIDPRFEPAFQSLAAALDAGDEPTAQLILDRILGRDPPPSTRALAEAYGRILRGRALARELDLALEGELADDDQTVALTLVANHPLHVELVLRGSTGTLSQILTMVDASGTEQRVSRSLALEEVAEVRLAPGAQTRVALGRYAVPIGGALAVEAEWDLRLPPGTLLVDDQELPVQFLTVRGCETRRVAPWLPDSEVEPGELARYVGAGGRAMPALMERAVRIEPERRGEALDALAPVALALPRIELAALVPALRWLSGERAIGADPEAWAQWLEALRATPPDPAPTGPDLPGNASVPRATVPAGGGAQR